MPLQIYATVGMHPHDAKDLDDETIHIFRDLAAHPKVLALGEMGLDYYRNLSPRPIQKAAFERQLDLAEELDLPIVIHNREAYHDILPILQGRGGRVRGVMHCFSGDVEIMHQSLALGFYIGIGGPVTYRKSDALQEVAQKVPAGRLTGGNGLSVASAAISTRETQRTGVCSCNSGEDCRIARHFVRRNW